MYEYRRLLSTIEGKGQYPRCATDTDNMELSEEQLVWKYTSQHWTGWGKEITNQAK
jgi:hypothetical protein